MSIVKAGRIKRVANTKQSKFPYANPIYNAIWVEDEDGGNERCLLFTDHEIKVAEARSAKNTEDLTKKDLLTDLLD